MILPLLQHLSHEAIDEKVLSSIRLKGELYLAAEAVLSASYFGELRWKRAALALLDRFLEGDSSLASSEHALLQARTNMRRVQILHLSTPRPIFGVEAMVQYPSLDNPRAKAYAIDLALIQCRDLIRQNKLDLAQQVIQHYLDPDPSLSTLETLKYDDLRLMHGIVCRFEGRFSDAWDILSPFPQSDSRTLSYASAIMCELGEQEGAIEKLHGWLQLSTSLPPAAKRRVELSLANAYLMKAMRGYMRGNQEEETSYSLTMAHDIFTRLDSTQSLPWFEQMSVRIGKAIVLQLRNSQDEAMQAWQSVRYLILEFELAPAYLDMITAYATSELEMRRGEATTSEILWRRAKSLFRETGRQYYFTGLGSVWPSIIDSWVLRRGGDPIFGASPC